MNAESTRNRYTQLVQRCLVHSGKGYGAVHLTDRTGNMTECGVEITSGNWYVLDSEKVSLVTCDKCRLLGVPHECSDEIKFIPNPRAGYTGNVFMVTYPNGSTEEFRAETWRDAIADIGCDAVKLEVIGTYTIDED